MDWVYFIIGCIAAVCYVVLTIKHLRKAKTAKELMEALDRQRKAGAVLTDIAQMSKNFADFKDNFVIAAKGRRFEGIFNEALDELQELAKSHFSLVDEEDINELKRKVQR